ncbi:MAG: TonB family protein [Tateyamaria sp.]|jgi:protein TonB|uniref:cell envelope integrity protein TolA n=1 Tax=Tateyamaria sp. TaxID=1929288 RepID=UPI0032DCD534
MIANSRGIAILSMAFAGATHLGGVMWLVPQEKVRIAGGQVGATQASLGDAFEAMATGTLTAMETTDVTEDAPTEDPVEAIEPPETAKTSAPENVVSATETIDVIEVTQPDQSAYVVETAQPVQQAELASNADTQEQAMPLETTPSEPIARVSSAISTVARLKLVVAVEPNTLGVLVAASPTDDIASPAPLQSPALQNRQHTDPPPERSTALTPVEPTEQIELQVLTAQEPDRFQVTHSLRPRERSRDIEERHAGKALPPKAAQKPRTAPQPQGNQAPDNRRIGQIDGTFAAAPARRTTDSSNSAVAGNAAISNYVGQVMRKIQRVRRPPSGVDASAIVTFRIAANGGLSALSIARSSGNAQLDRTALQMIQRAAPFPPPPPGADRLFSIPIKGR